MKRELKNNEEFRAELSKVLDLEKTKYRIDELTYGSSKKKIWVKCTNPDTPYHGSYETTCYEFSIGRGCSFCAKKKIHPYDSFGYKNKEILDKIWDKEKNTENPYSFAVNSKKKKVWIKCIYNSNHPSIDLYPRKFDEIRKCKICKNHQVVLENSFAYKYKEILKEIWDYNLNIVKPEEIYYKSSIKIWVKCCNKPYHGSFEVSCLKYSGKKHQCKYCTGREVHYLDSFGTKYYNDLEEIWDYKLNEINPFEVYKGSTDYIRVKCCNKDYHGSFPVQVYKYKGKAHRCPLCTQNKSVHIKDSFGSRYEDILDEIWDYELNEENPFKISQLGNTYVYIKCRKVNYHESSYIRCADFSLDRQCPSCVGQKTAYLDSFGYMYKDMLEEIWDYKLNELDPYTISKNSGKHVWFKCKEKKHKSYYRTIYSSINYEFRCPKCSAEQKESRLQRKVREYLEELGFNLLHEGKCTLTPINPKTGRKMYYDNEVCELNLLIEVNGEQHYKCKEFFFKNEKEFQELQERDSIKKQIAIEKKYEFLIIKYDLEKDEQYKLVIDKKIQEILDNKPELRILL